VTPHQKIRDGKPVGTLAFDRVIKGVGRFRCASGTTDKRVFRRMDEMLSVLYDQGRSDLIAAMKSGKLPMMQVYTAYRQGEIERLPSVDQLIPLVGALSSFAENYECSDKHRETLWTFHNYAKKHAPADAKVPALPDTLKTLRVILSDSPTMFNRIRAAALAFVRSHYGKGSKLWLAVAQVETLKVTPKVIKHPATVAEMVELTAKMPTTIWRHWKQEPCDFAGMAWTMATTGMRTVVEYFDGEWAKKSGFLEIGTGKKDKALRRVPLIREPVEAECDYQAFADAIHEATSGQMTPYDLRRTYANWLEAAEIPRTRRMIYMGHGAVDITGRYEWHEVKAFLAEDAEKVKGWLDAEIAKAQAAKKPTLRAIK
jgi:integrase